MPIEREVKFLLKYGTKAADVLALGTDLSSSDPWRIEQTYLSGGVRVRRVTSESSPLHPVFFYNWKAKTKDGRMEIEQVIFKNDYDSLMSIKERELIKTRTEIRHKSHPFDLELDRFVDTLNHRFGLVMIEVEYEEEQKGLIDLVEAFLKPVLVRRIDEDDDRFSNYRLADPYYMLGLMVQEYGLSVIQDTDSEYYKV